MSKPSQNFQKEAQATIAFVILDSLYHENKTTSKAMIIAKMNDAFHGNRGKASQVDLFRSGATVYKSLFIDDGSASNDGLTDFALIVPPLLSRHSGGVLVNVDTTLPKPVLEATSLKGGSKITGSTLFNLADEALENCKKALAFASEFLDTNGNPPSGKNVDDYVKFILQKMYASTMASSTNNAVEDLEEIDDDESDPAVGTNASGDPADNWFFRGFWAFYIFGPYPNKANSTTLLELGDISQSYQNKALVGRAHAQKKQRQDSGFAQSADDTSSKAKPSSPWKRGVCMKYRIAVTRILQQEQLILQRQHECNVLSLGKALIAKGEMMLSTERIFVHTGDPNYFQEYMKTKEEYAAMTEEMKKMKSPALQVAAAPNAMVAQLVNSTLTVPECHDVACMLNFPGNFGRPRFSNPVRSESGPK